MLSKMQYEYQKLRLESIKAYKANLQQIALELEMINKNQLNYGSREQWHQQAQINNLEKNRSDNARKLLQAEQEEEEFKKAEAYDKQHREIFGDTQVIAAKEEAARKQRAEDNRQWLHRFQIGEVTLEDTIRQIVRHM